MESFFSTVKSELREHFDSNGEAKMELFDYIEVFYNQRRRRAWTLPSLWTRRTRPQVTWKTAQNAVSHSAHTHYRFRERRTKKETQPA